MKIDYKIVLLVIAFLGVYIGLHYFVLGTLFYLFNLDNGKLLYLFTIFLAILYPLAMYVERKYPNKISRALYAVSATWLGILFLSFFFVIFYFIINLIFPLPRLLTGKIIITSVILLTIYGIINGWDIKIRKVNIKIKNLKNELKIVQLSDLHLGTMKNSAFLERVVNITNSLSPDIVVITGDLVDGSAPLHHGMIRAIDRIKVPIFYVTGNHEVYDGVSRVLKIIKDTKIRHIKNKKEIFNGIQIAGIDYLGESKKKVFSALKKIKLDRKMPSILLYHSPISIRELEKVGINLHLAGHTHNGQIFPFNLLVKIAFRNSYGLFNRGNSYQYVTSGTGLWGPPMRIGSKSEIVLINLKKH